MNRFYGFCLMAGSVLFAGCAPRPITMQDVDPLADAWETAYEAGDEDAIAALYTADATLLPPEHPPLQGPDAIRAYYADVPPGLDIEIITEDARGQGDQAHGAGTYRVQQGDHTMASGNWALMLVREGDTWKIRRHLANSDMTPEAQAAMLTSQLDAVAAAYEAAYNSGDRDALTAIYTTDATLMPPHSQPIMGREKIREGLPMPPGTVVDVEVTDALSLGDDVHGFGTVTFQTETGQMVDHSNWAAVFQQEDGQWKIDRLMWSSEMPMMAESSDALREAVEAANERFEAAFGAGDAAALAALYSLESTLLPPNSAVIRGMESIEGFWRSTMEAGVRGVDLQTEEVFGVGDLIYEVGTATLKGRNDRVLDEAKYLVVWKYEDGQWKLHRDIWNTNRPAQ